MQFYWLGYINNCGILDLVRFEMFLQSLSSVRVVFNVCNGELLF